MWWWWWWCVGRGGGVQQTECSKCFITNALYMKKRNNPKGLIYLFASVCFLSQ